MAGLDQAGGGMALTGFTLNEIIKQHQEGRKAVKKQTRRPLVLCLSSLQCFGEGSKLTSGSLSLLHFLSHSPVLLLCSAFKCMYSQWPCITVNGILLFYAFNSTWMFSFDLYLSVCVCECVYLIFVCVSCCLLKFDERPALK